MQDILYIITGTSRGIGYEIKQLLLKEKKTGQRTYESIAIH